MAAFPSKIPVQGELRHQKDGSSNIDDGAIHRLAFVPREESCVSKLPDEVAHVGRAIVSADGDQDDQTQRNLTDRAIAHAHARLGHPLDDGSHPLKSVRAR